MTCLRFGQRSRSPPPGGARRLRLERTKLASPTTTTSPSTGGGDDVDAGLDKRELPPRHRSCPVSPTTSQHLPAAHPGHRRTGTRGKARRVPTETVWLLSRADRRRSWRAAAVVVTDVVTQNQTLAEKTTDCTRRTTRATSGTSRGHRETRRRRHDPAGTWEAGVDKALPGVAMPAAPRVGRTFRQGVPSRRCARHRHDLDVERQPASQRGRSTTWWSRSTRTRSIRARRSTSSMRAAWGSCTPC